MHAKTARQAIPVNPTDQVRKLRRIRMIGLANGRQVAGTKLALAHGSGGVPSSQATVILGAPKTV